MTNREFKKQRNFYKKQQLEGHLQYFYDTEEYKLFVNEEAKRASAKQITNENFKNQKLDPKLREVAFKYLKKYETLDKERMDFLKTTYSNRNLDVKVVAKCLHKIIFFNTFFSVKEELICAYCFDGQVFYKNSIQTNKKPENPKTEFKKAYKDAVLKLKNETCAFATALKQAKEDIKNIKQKEAEFEKQKQIIDQKIENKKQAILLDYNFKASLQK